MPISTESQYLIDSMYELCRITGDISQYVYHTQLDVDRLVDRFELDDYNESTLEGAVTDSYKKWRPTAKINSQMLTSLNGIIHSEQQLNEIMMYISDRIAENFLESNGKKIKHSGFLPDKNIDLYIATKDDMLKPSNIEHMLIRFNPQWLPLFKQQYDDFVDVLQRVNFPEFIKWDKERIRLLDIEHQKNIAMLRGGVWSEEEYKHILPGKQMKKAKKVIKKSIKTFINLFGEDDIKTFVTGHDVIISGEKYNYRIAKKYDIFDHSANPNKHHVPYTFQLLTKENIVMADGCIYFEKTPIIDQIIALMLHIKSGNEDEILDKTIFSRLTDAYYSDSFIMKLKKTYRHNDNADENISIRDYFYDMTVEADEIQSYRPKIKPVIIQVLKDMLQIPSGAFDFMLKPTIQYDEIHMINSTSVETALLEFKPR